MSFVCFEDGNTRIVKKNGYDEFVLEKVAEDAMGERYWREVPLDPAKRDLIATILNPILEGTAVLAVPAKIVEST